MKKLVSLVAALTLISSAAWAAQAGESEGSQTKKSFKSSETTVPKQSSGMETQSSQGAESQAAQRPFKSSKTLDSSTAKESSEEQESQGESLNELLKSELASVETYRQALDKFRQESQQATFQQLNTIYNDHQDAVSQLKTQVREAGGEVADGSGAWGTWAKLVMGSAKLLGEETAIKTLKEGEESGVENYQECLREGDLSAEAKSLVQTTLLPRQQAHVQDLDKLLQNLSAQEEKTEQGASEQETQSSLDW